MSVHRPKTAQRSPSSRSDTSRPRHDPPDESYTCSPADGGIEPHDYDDYDGGGRDSSGGRDYINDSYNTYTSCTFNTYYDVVYLGDYDDGVGRDDRGDDDDGGGGRDEYDDGGGRGYDDYYDDGYYDDDYGDDAPDYYEDGYYDDDYGDDGGLDGDEGVT